MKKHKLFCKRAGIEPTIGHLKSDYRLGRNFYKGIFGDAINLILACSSIQLQKSREGSLGAYSKMETILRNIENPIGEEYTTNRIFRINDFLRGT